LEAYFQLLDASGNPDIARIENEIIRDAVQSHFQQRVANESVYDVKAKYAEFVRSTREEVTREFDGHNLPIRILDLAMNEPPKAEDPAVEEAIHAEATAEIQRRAEVKKQDLARLTAERQIEVKRLQAEGEAGVKRITAEAEAAAFVAVSRGYGIDPDLLNEEERIEANLRRREIEAMEKIGQNGNLTIVTIPGGAGSLLSGLLGGDSARGGKKR
jgi:regulator of protease activity HflC (stomatin/prohibitin superfamily)